MERKIKEIVSDTLCVHPSKVVPEANLENDLGADSLDQIEVLVNIEKEFDIDIPDKDAEKIKTVGDIILCVRNHTRIPK